MLSFHSPYLDYLCEQVREVVRLFPDADGIFLDIINQNEDCSEWAMRYMKEKGLDPLKKEDRLQSRFDSLMKYYNRVTDTVRSESPDMPIFHNSGHITPGFRDILPFFSHLELESLPTGGWGYDHFPFSAKYVAKLDMDFLGMTGKFHSTWGEFGGYKHPNALRYECAAMLAYGARCSVGDQLHPSGELDTSTYEIIGEAYREVRQKEQWVEGARNVADIALLSSESLQGEKSFRNHQRGNDADIGAVRVLLEEHFLFDVIDAMADFDQYPMLILPDEVIVDESLKLKLDAYLNQGGKLFLTGDSGLNENGRFEFDVGSEVGPASEFQPDFILPIEGLRADFVNHPQVMYGRSRRLKVKDGESMGEIYDPFFNREWDHFCSHQHTPAEREPSGYDSGVCKGRIVYLAHPVFTIYRGFGQVALRQMIGKAIRHLLAEDETLKLTNFPSTARAVLTRQTKQDRFILHLLYANTINRGGEASMSGGNLSARQQSFEVIEELIPLRDIGVQLKGFDEIKSLKRVPGGEDQLYEQKDGELRFQLDRLECAQMIEIQF